MTTSPPITDSLQRPLPKRFYTAVTVAARNGAFGVDLDGRPTKTPLKRTLVVPVQDLAAPLAAEWASQVGVINPALMPLTRLVATAIDAVAGKETEVAASIAAYGQSDLLCYRAESPDGLISRQAAAWDPVLAWAARDLGATFQTTRGLIHVTQSQVAQTAVARALQELPALALAALHVLTTITGSVLLALAVHRRFMTLDEAWLAAHVDEDWQISLWGEDQEAQTRRAHRLVDARTAALVLAHS